MAESYDNWIKELSLFEMKVKTVTFDPDESSNSNRYLTGYYADNEAADTPGTLRKAEKGKYTGT